MTGMSAPPLTADFRGAARYIPEANVLVPRTTDPDSKTPAFKCVLI